MACSSALVDGLCHARRYRLSPTALATVASGRYSAQHSLWDRAIPPRTRIALGSLVLRGPLPNSRGFGLEACRLARISDDATHSRHVGAGPLIRTPPSALGGRLQPLGLLADLVADRRSDLPSLLCGPPPSPDRQYVRHRDVGRFLVGYPTQRVPASV